MVLVLFSTSIAQGQMQEGAGLKTDTVFVVDTLSDMDKLRIAENRIDDIRSYSEMLLGYVGIGVLIVLALNVGSFFAYAREMNRRQARKLNEAKDELRSEHEENLAKYEEEISKTSQIISMMSSATVGLAIIDSKQPEEKPSLWSVIFRSAVIAIGHLIRLERTFPSMEARLSESLLVLNVIGRNNKCKDLPQKYVDTLNADLPLIPKNAHFDADRGNVELLAELQRWLSEPTSFMQKVDLSYRLRDIT